MRLRGVLVVAALLAVLIGCGTGQTGQTPPEQLPPTTPGVTAGQVGVENSMPSPGSAAGGSGTGTTAPSTTGS